MSRRRPTRQSPIARGGSACAIRRCLRSARSRRKSGSPRTTWFRSLRSATFRLEHVGILQSTLYAFGETRPGAIRDLAAHDTNIPVAKGGESETLLLATARRPAAFYETIKTSLANANGERRDLGAAQSVVGPDKIASRGIGAGIASVPSSMIVVKPRHIDLGKGDGSDADALLETCRYRLIQPKV